MNPRMEGQSPLRLLVLGPNPKNAQGGLSVFVATLIKRISGSIAAETLWIGRAPGESAIGTVRRMWKDVRRLSARLKTGTPDVVQINVSMNVRSLVREYFLCRRILKAARPRLVTVFHGWDSNVANNIAGSKLLRFLFRRSFARSNRVLVLSSAFASELLNLGVNKEIVYVLPQGFDDEFLADFQTIPANKKKNILFMSRLIPEKGALELISAFRSGKASKWPDWTLTIAGDGPQRSIIEKAIARVDNDDGVRFVGYARADTKKSLLGEASVFALPTRYNEGLPIAIVEAMAAGCALLCTGIAGLGDVVRDVEHGVVIASNGTDNVAAGLGRLLPDPELIQSASHNCHRMAWQKFTATSVFAELEAHIEAAHCGNG